MNILVFIDVLKESREPISWLSISRKMHCFLYSKKVRGCWGLRIMSHHPYPTSGLSSCLSSRSKRDHVSISVLLILSTNFSFGLPVDYWDRTPSRMPKYYIYIYIKK